MFFQILVLLLSTYHVRVQKIKIVFLETRHCQKYFQTKRAKMTKISFVLGDEGYFFYVAGGGEGSVSYPWPMEEEGEGGYPPNLVGNTTLVPRSVQKIWNLELTGRYWSFKNQGCLALQNNNVFRSWNGIEI